MVAEESSALDMSRKRLLLSLVLGATVIVGIYGRPPDIEIAGLDLRFGSSGPSAGDPWKWFGAALLLVVVVAVERRGLGSLLIRRPTSRDIEWVLYAFGAVMSWAWLIGLIAPQRNNDGIETVIALGVVGVLALIVTAAVTEEIVYRGFLAERLGELFGGGQAARWFGAATSLAIFVLPHLVFFGQSWLLHQLPGAAAIAAIALVRRNLPAAMLLHLLINLPMLIPTVMGG